MMNREQAKEGECFSSY